jgi:cytochrome P450
LNQRVLSSLFGAKFKVSLFSLLQRRFPLVKIPFTNLVVVNKHELVTELLNRDEDFTIEEINAKKMASLEDAFFLGMDRMNPQFDAERNFVRKAARREDMDLIRAFVVSQSQSILNLAKSYGKIDVANSLTRVIMTRLISFYFGVQANSDEQMKEWLRAIFWDLFLNLGDDQKIHDKGKKAANSMKTLIEQTISNRKAELKRNGTLDDNLLNRFIIMQQEEGNSWFDDDAIRRNISGIITGALETTNKSVILVLDELFRRPKVLKEATKVAHDNDMKKMYGYVAEALRFNPHQPLVMRYTETKQVLNTKGKKYTIPAKKKIFAITSAAMFSPNFFPKPKEFNPSRESVYMNYGFALHECYGKYINQVTITEFVAAILRLPNLKRASGSIGHQTGLMEGPFPNNFVVEFG